MFRIAVFGFVTTLAGSAEFTTVDLEGNNLRIVDPHGKTSHFIRRDPEHILAWAYHPSHGERLCLCRDGAEKAEFVAPNVTTNHGHCTSLPLTQEGQR